MANGSLGALTWEEKSVHPEWVINKHDVWDYRHPKVRRHSMAHMHKIAEEDLLVIPVHVVPRGRVSKRVSPHRRPPVLVGGRTNEDDQQLHRRRICHRRDLR